MQIDQSDGEQNDLASSNQVHLTRDNTTYCFFLGLMDRAPNEQRDITEELTKVISTINGHPRPVSTMDDDPYILKGQQSGNYVAFLQCENGVRRGFSRQFFKKENAYGRKCVE